MKYRFFVFFILLLFAKTIQAQPFHDHLEPEQGIPKIMTLGDFYFKDVYYKYMEIDEQKSYKSIAQFYSPNAPHHYRYISKADGERVNIDSFYNCFDYAYDLKMNDKGNYMLKHYSFDGAKVFTDSIFINSKLGKDLYDLFYNAVSAAFCSWSLGIFDGSIYYFSIIDSTGQLKIASIDSPEEYGYKMMMLVNTAESISDYIQVKVIDDYALSKQVFEISKIIAEDKLKYDSRRIDYPLWLEKFFGDNWRKYDSAAVFAVSDGQIYFCHLIDQFEKPAGYYLNYYFDDYDYSSTYNDSIFSLTYTKGDEYIEYDFKKIDEDTLRIDVFGTSVAEKEKKKMGRNIFYKRYIFGLW